MPSTGIGVQIEVELTKIFLIHDAVQKAGKFTLKAVLDLACQLQNSGSDLLIEEDLASVFDREIIVNSIRNQFQTDILKNANINLTHEGCELALSSSTESSFNRAIKNAE